MGNEANTQNEEIERYVGGLMDEAENLDFESQLMIDSDLRESVEGAIILFEQSRKNEWEFEINEQLTKLSKSKDKDTGQRLKQWFSWKYTFVPSALAFSLGVLVMLIVPNGELQIGGAKSVSLNVLRSVDNVQKVFINENVDILEFNISIKDIPDKFFNVEIDTGEKKVVRKGVKPELYEEKIKVYLTGELDNNQQLTLRLLDSHNREKRRFNIQIIEE